MGRIIYATEACVRESNTTQYTANDEWSNDDTAPTAYLLAELSGQSGIIKDVVIVSSNDPATLLQGEFCLADDSMTLVNDNAAFALTDADSLKLVSGLIPFTLVSSAGGSGTNSLAHVIGIDTAFDCTNKAGLYLRVKVKNAYTPASAETLNFRFKIERAAG